MPQPVARHRRRGGLGAGARRAGGAPGARVDGAVGAVPRRCRALRVRRARARESAARLPADARDRDRALLVLGARRGWPSTAARRGRASARGSPSCSSCSRASRRSRRATGGSSSAGRSPGSPATTESRGTLVFVAVMLGSTSFDGFSRTSSWQDLIRNVRADLADSSQRTVDLAMMFVNLGGLAFFVAAILATYLAAVAAAEKLGRRAPLTRSRLRAPARPDRRGVHGRPLLHALP